MATEYEIVRITSAGVEVLETRSGDLPGEGELIEVLVDGSDVEWYVHGTEIVNKRVGKMWRVTVGPNEPRLGGVGLY